MTIILKKIVQLNPFKADSQYNKISTIPNMACGPKSPK